MTPIAYINVEKRRLEFAEPIKWYTPTVANLDRVPLFTQRTWVGLTEERIKEIWLNGKDHGDDWTDVLILARAFEAELKEKNT
jgi:hypothetical protein